MVALLLMGTYLAQLWIYPEKEFSVLRNQSYTPILNELTYKRQLLNIILDLGLLAFSYYLSYWLRFSDNEFAYYFVFLDTVKRKALGGDKTLIYGAGCGGELLLREILNNGRLKIQPIGFLDDDVLKTGKRLQGFPILGTFSDLDRLVNKYDTGY